MFKIGRSKNPISRLRQIEQIRGDCEIITTIDYDCESLLHNVFAISHIGGEWFLLNDNDIQDVFDLKNGGNAIVTEFEFLTYPIKMIAKNSFIELTELRSICIHNKIEYNFNPIQMLRSADIQIFILDLNKRIGNVISNSIGQKNTWIHILLFLELARNIHPKLRLEVYEKLTNLTDVNQIVRLALKEGKKY